MKPPVPSRDMALVDANGKLTPHGYDLLKRLSDVAAALQATTEAQDVTLADHEARLVLGGL